MLILLALGGFFWYFFRSETEIVSPLVSSLVGKPSIINKYSPYTFEALSQKVFKQGIIKLTNATKYEKDFTTWVFTYESDGKIISGMANIPLAGTRGEPSKFPVVILLRGYADQKNYHVGLGTERSANSLAEAGFLTLAPDFLGYGYSDWEDKDILLSRFYRPVEVLNLLAAVDSLPSADISRIGLWGHSNGGQIALSVLEITGKSYPTSLWAPVSLGFPESVLTYMGSQEEVGSTVSAKIKEFSLDNDPKKYSIAEYFVQIKAPFVIHQGIADELIKLDWTSSLVEKLKSLGLAVDFYKYSRENHNFNRFESTGELMRQRDILFFKKYLQNLPVAD